MRDHMTVTLFIICVLVLGGIAARCGPEEPAAPHTVSALDLSLAGAFCHKNNGTEAVSIVPQETGDARVGNVKCRDGATFDAGAVIYKYTDMERTELEKDRHDQEHIENIKRRIKP